jgi:cytochrome c peroxidase
MRRPIQAAVLAALAVATAGTPARAADPLLEQARRLFAPLPPDAATAAHAATPEQIALGRMLYHETRLAPGQDGACSSCHRLDAFGAGGPTRALGHPGQREARNAPAVYNAALHVAQFWDGRGAAVEEAARPAQGQPLAALKAIPGYAPAFAAAFPGDADPITAENVGRAVGAFARRLVTPSRFDAFLAGDAEALTGDERKGLASFIATGCPACHTGVAVGGATFEKLGLLEPYPTQDKGRALVTGRRADEYVFKVPSLRNVARTGPWLHDGSLDTLDLTVRVMARVQLGRTLTDAEAGSIVKFLEALTGEIPRDLVTPPELPPGGTPAPAPG